ncbi:DUF4360 domain-containing protein [Pseudonocardiaceae bacterium YIM PH 21723]|nr:DUF4360 domain-containing protein [Pseudonocardiaceae bacterium YIM PH 21723]
MILLIAALLTPLAGFAPPLTPVGLSVSDVSGSGCAKGSAAAAMSADNSAFTITYSAFLAQAGPGTKPADGRRSCRITLAVTPPAGTRYAVSSVDYRGFAHLSPGAGSRHRANYHFESGGAPDKITHTIAGPLDDNWSATDVVGAGKKVPSPCGKKHNLRIDTDLEVDAEPGAQSVSFLAIDSTDGSGSSTYRLDWQPC